MTQGMRGLKWLKHATRLAMLASVAVLPRLACAVIPAPGTAEVTWDPSPSPTVVGYNIYYGVASQDYTNMVSAGNVDSATVSNLVPGIVYFFSVTSHDIAGFESTLSNEASYLIPSLLVAAASDQTWVYGTTNEILTGSLLGLQTGDNITASYTTTANAASPVGTYSIVPVVNIPHGERADYTVTILDGTLTIVPATAAGVLTSSANPSLPGHPVTFGVALGALPPGGGTPTGTVQFWIDGVQAGEPTPLSSGVASYTTSSLSHGSHTVAAAYGGDGNFTGTTNLLVPAQVVDTPPVAGPYALTCGAGTAATVLISALLAGDSDADGDPLTLVGVSTSTANGGTVATNAGSVIYTPPPSSTNTDTFTYTISDGWEFATGVVTVDMNVVSSSSRNLVITRLGDGSFAVSGSGTPGQTYTIQYSAQLLPSLDWQTLGTATADTSGWFVVSDAARSSPRFYRVVCP